MVSMSNPLIVVVDNMKNVHFIGRLAPVSAITIPLGHQIQWISFMTPTDPKSEARRIVKEWYSKNLLTSPKMKDSISFGSIAIVDISQSLTRLQSETRRAVVEECAKIAEEEDKLFGVFIGALLAVAILLSWVSK